MSLGEGFGVGFRWVAGGGFPVRTKGKGDGEHGGWGGVGGVGWGGPRKGSGKRK